MVVKFIVLSCFLSTEFFVFTIKIGREGPPSIYCALLSLSKHSSLIYKGQLGVQLQENI
ncbi:hypothetical protein M758_9G144000 [Ceratodon purpureus]|nr:hypothetical protein M758_9G144000 [Ceratodon purpureus]